jgi:pimeloyl-ACP methyl ester carboxylesterase
MTRLLRPPGRLVQLDTHRLHLHCIGEGTPTVVFDAALGASSLSWVHVQPAVARVTRTCTYDRAGLGWSEAGPLPRTAGRIANELHTLLQRGATPPPYVLVGHSFGGLVAELFALRHIEDVCALVLIEPAIPQEWQHLGAERQALIDRGLRLCRYGSAAARFGIARLVAVLVRFGALAAARAIAKVVSRGSLGREDEGILAPIWKLPADTRRALRYMWVQPKFYEALGSQIASIHQSVAEVLAERPPHYGDLPLVLISARTAARSRLEADRALSERSTQGRHILADESGHWVPLDAPQVVTRAILDVIEQVRRGAVRPASTAL